MVTASLSEANKCLIMGRIIYRYAMVKQLGSNPSQIDGIDIGKGNTDKLTAGQTLHVVSMKFPHKLSVCLASDSKGSVPRHAK